MKKLIIFFISLMFFGSCEPRQETKSDTGVKKAQLTVETDRNGNTIEQRNIIKRLKTDNSTGSIKHLYLISPMSGQVLLYSTVDGKVTSGSKRLTPSTVASDANYGGAIVNIGGESFRTEEILGDDGTYGSSCEYIYWWDVRGVYHQQFITSGSVVIHISDQPIAVKSIVINIEDIKDKK